MVVAWAAQGAAPTGGGMTGIVSSVIFLLFFIAIFYFMLIWPQRRKQRQHRELIEDLKRGDEVVTSGGIIGKVKKVNKDNIILEVEEGMTLKILKDAVAERLQ